MLERLHASRVSEFRRILRACAIAASRGRHALVLLVPKEQDPDAFMRAFYTYARERAGRPVRQFALCDSPWPAALGTLVGIGNPAPVSVETLQDLLFAADRMFQRLRAALSRDLATDEAGPGLLVVQGDISNERTFLGFLSHLSPPEAMWRAIPGPKASRDQFVVVASMPTSQGDPVSLPKGVETLEVRPIEPEDIRAAPDAAAEILLLGLSGQRMTRASGPAPRGALSVDKAIQAGLYHDMALGETTWGHIQALCAAGQAREAVELACANREALTPDQLMESAQLALVAAESEPAMALVQAAAPRGAHPAAVACIMAEAMFIQAQVERAAALAREALCANTPLQYRSCALNTLGKVAFRAGRHDEAEQLFVQVHDLLPGGLEAARATHNLGLVALRRGDLGQAVLKLQEAVLAAESLGEAQGAALARRNLAIALEHQGRYQAAMEYALEALDRLSRLNAIAHLPNAILTVADLLVTFGEWDRAMALVEAAEGIAASTGQAQVVTVCHRLRGECALLRGDALAATRELEAAYAEFRSRGFADDAAFCAARLAEACLALGALKEALRWAEVPTGQGEARGRALVVMGRAALLEGKPAQAASTLSKGRDILAALRQREPLAMATAALADAMEALGDQAAALNLREEARSLLEEVSGAVPAEYRKAFRARPGISEVIEAQPEPTGLVAPMSRATPVTPQLRHRLPKILGDSQALRRTLVMIERVRDVNVPVLLLGESGTGKELLAEALHLLSPRARGPFVRVNAAAFTDTLLLSELFGHERGAFTGAHARKIGRFEAANGGTLFLDEIGDVSEHLQTALLRVIEEQRFQRVGGVDTVRVDVRLVFATNRDLNEAMRAGRFREDLFHRISAVTIPVPPLRERVEDIPVLAEHFAAELASETGREVSLSADAIELLCSWRWPGNVRELKNVVRKACLMAEGSTVTRETLLGECPELRHAGRRPAAGGLDVFDMVFGRGLSLFQARAEVEVALIREALSQTGGNISAAAQLLGMKRPRLSQMVKEYGLKVDAGATPQVLQPRRGSAAKEGRP